jgi:hypothetical protein
MIRRQRSLSVCFASLLASMAHAGVIYENNFEGQGPGPEWLGGVSLATTPQGCIRCTSFLGEFGNQIILLNLANLPTHSVIALGFDLYTIRSWDGNVTYVGGPDIFHVVESMGRADFQTTFSNNYVYGDQFNQAYPGTYPGGVFPSQSGAFEKQTLGYTFDNFGYGVVREDAVYHLSFTFAHSDPTLLVLFRAQNLSPLADESWGLDNVVVSGDTPTNIPEPGTILLVSAGLLFLAVPWVLKIRKSRTSFAKVRPPLGARHNHPSVAPLRWC